MDYKDILSNCTICPRKCKVNRLMGQTGFCKSKYLIKAALSSVHNGEEPCISGARGSGTIFFSGCNMRCIFCQNYTISSENFGKEITEENLADIFIKQQNKNVHNINLVTPTHFIPQIRNSIILAKKKGLKIPIIYNTNSYEKIETLKMLDGLIDIYIPDLKYFDDQYAIKYSSAPNYFEIATKAILEMFRQTGKNKFNKDNIMQKGVLIRHLVLPNCRKDSIKILDWIKNNLDSNVYVSLMRQYTPMYNAKNFKELNRKITSFEYDSVIDYFFKIGLKNGYMQNKESAVSTYIPNFNLEGIN